MAPEVGISLPTSGAAIPDIAEAARAAESLGFDSVWAGDHLADARPILDSTLALTTAAAVTGRVKVGFGVLQLALRQPAWAAKQIGSLQYLSGGRLILGVGVGGLVPGEWEAAGIPLSGRGKRTESILRALPGLLAGEPTRLTTEPGAPEVTLTPAVPVPPVWLGAISERGLRRAAEYGDGWLATITTPAELAAGAGKVRAMAGEFGRPAPVTGCSVLVGETRSAVSDFLRARLGLEPERADAIAVGGGAREIADRLACYTAAEHLVLSPFGQDWRAQLDVLAEARALLLA
ncbi:Flavin-dependent oxidoreductase, luciferase family (includes alkanesulfonate monooxygenase SsuD and methylene tetrahydromethanopterin reductase) [Amycolatopsis xylanica]|uniref:Flavin-dependent oxidoreductase, luciferase family (Includes alkanesulfonate monooxygenase SsuD and methylene tetrahydromethanopterin reductase) n=1 Tax=Amycolatopsis xylanica TaxID=589385 RepID=A0A1H2VRB3_9PSEU|nr:LLM class flavin-dependent oxidoreductase [Amycolatopsis xylanica]SDW70942.1 Flavin-dependent oxidoreductase, luciferase family (includes alkanesulfonate monooxygenase SsuD and methylene tetrahydromethanopterin reductase) [Amycolatopsis xylanica]